MAPSVMVRRHCRGGWTLVDTLLSMIFLALLAAILQSFALASMHALRVRQVADDLDETARIALEIVARDIRDTGYGLAGTADRGLRGASAEAIHLARDLDLDGATISSNERVGYLIDRGAQQLRRQLGNASPQPMVDHLDPEQPLFRFRDKLGDEIVAASELDTGQRAAVKQIEITLRLTAPHPVRSGERIVVVHRASVGLRNGQI